jgi:hypothetical protein
MNLSQLQTAALRLGVARDDPKIRLALDTFRSNEDEAILMNTLREIANETVEVASSAAVEEEERFERGKVISSAEARAHVFPILIAELEKEKIISSGEAKILLKLFEEGNVAILAALDEYDLDSDMSELVDTFQKILSRKARARRSRCKK